jgi:hypothetical protein
MLGRGGLGLMRSRGGGLLDVDAALYLATMTVSEPAVVQAAVDFFVRSLKATGAWAKLDRCFLALGTEQASLRDLKNPAKTATNAGCAFTPYRGFKGNGTAAHLSFGETFAAAGNQFAQDSAFLFSYCNEQGALAGLRPHIANGSLGSIRPSNNTGGLAVINDAGTQAPWSVGRVGSRLLNRVSPAAKQVYENGVGISGDLAEVSTAPGAGLAYVLRQASSYADDQIAAAGWGGGLTNGQAVAFQTALHVLLSRLGANYGFYADPSVAAGPVYLVKLNGESNATNHAEDQRTYYPGMRTPLVPSRAMQMNNDGGPGHLTVLNTTPVTWAAGTDGFDPAKATALDSLHDGHDVAPTFKGPLGQGIMHAALYTLDAELAARGLPKRLMGAVINGQGGQKVQTLAKNGALYNGANLYQRGLNMVTRFKELAASKVGRSTEMLANFWDEGINYRGNFVGDDPGFDANVAIYKAALLDIFGYLGPDDAAITGGPTPPTLFQQCTGFGQGLRVTATQAQFLIALNPPAGVYPCRPRHWFEFASSSHHSAKGAVLRGESYGFDLADLVQALAPRCLLPVNLAINGQAITFNTFDRRVNGLVDAAIDTVTMPDPGALVGGGPNGFKIGSTNDAAITSVAANASQITVMLDRVPASPRISYAESGPGRATAPADDDGTEEFTGRGHGGQWGNIRDTSGWNSRLVPGHVHRNPLWAFGQALF